MLFLRFLSLFCLLSLSIVFSGNAGLITAQRFVKDGQVVVLFGDQHKYLRQEDENDQRAQQLWEQKAILQWPSITESLSNYEKVEKNNKPLTVLYEGRSCVLEENVPILNSVADFRTTLNFALLAKRPLIKYVNIERRDYLGLVREALEALLFIAQLRDPLELSKTLRNIIPTKILSQEKIEEKMKAVNSRLEEELLKIIRLLKNITFSSIWNQFQTTLQFAHSRAHGTMLDIIQEMNKQYKELFSDYLEIFSEMRQGTLFGKDEDLCDYFINVNVQLKIEDVRILNKIFKHFLKGTVIVNDLSAIWYIEKKREENIAVFVGDMHRENIAHYLKRLGYVDEEAHNVDSESFKRTFDLFDQKDQCKNLLDHGVIAHFMSAMGCDKK